MTTPWCFVSRNSSAHVCVFTDVLHNVFIAPRVYTLTPSSPILSADQGHCRLKWLQCQLVLFIRTKYHFIMFLSSNPDFFTMMSLQDEFMLSSVTFQKRLTQSDEHNYHSFMSSQHPKRPYFTKNRHIFYVVTILETT